VSALKSKRQHLTFSAEDRPCYAQRQPAETVELVLPVPPSTNALYRNKRGGGRVKTEAYRIWRAAAEQLGNAQRPGRRVGQSDLSLYVPPGRADRSNLIKPLEDAAKAIGVIADDSPKYIRNVSIIVDASRSDCLLVFRPTDDFGVPF
jgi:Holliday junction resolvase RusA-like endonuclease